MNPFLSLLRATEFAADKHKNQRRKDAAGTPYINHPIQVAHFLARAGVINRDVLIAALLHDTIEDTNTTFSEIQNAYGPTVAMIVKEVSDDKSLPKEVRKQLQIEHAATISTEAKLVKLADKLSNISGLDSDPPKTWSQAEIDGYLCWAYATVDAMKGTNAYLENELMEVFKRSPCYEIMINPTALQARLELYYQNIINSE